MVQEISGEDEFRRLTGSKGKLVVVSRCSVIVLGMFRSLARLKRPFLSLVILNICRVRDGVLALYGACRFTARLTPNLCTCTL